MGNSIFQIKAKNIKIINNNFFYKYILFISLLKVHILNFLLWSYIHTQNKII